MSARRGQGARAVLLATAALCALNCMALAQEADPQTAARPVSRDDLFVRVEVMMPRPRPRPEHMTQALPEETRPRARPGTQPVLASDAPQLQAPALLAAPASADVMPRLDLAQDAAPGSDLTAPAALPQPGTDMLQAQAPQEPLPLVRTSDFSLTTFKADRRALEETYIAAEGYPKAGAALELARLLTSQMLLPEARSYLNRALTLGVKGDPRLDRQAKAQGLMLDVLQQKDWSSAVLEGWAEASLWAVAAKATPAEISGAVGLTEAVAQLQNHAPPVVAALLPQVFDAALIAGEFALAERLLQGARQMTNLASEPIYHLMMGRLALAYDLPQQGFDYFARAANGRDLAAQQARIAMADLALQRKDPKLLPALRDILSEGVNQWRYGREGLILRARLAQVSEDLGDIPVALDIMGKIRIDHPGTAEAILAHERGALAMAAFAAAMDQDEIDLPTYLQTLRNVEPFYRLDPIWPIARSALGRAFNRAGLHTAAAAEFAALQNDFSRVGAPAPLERVRQEVPLAEAESWLENHELDLAKIALAREGLPHFEALQERFALASLKAGTSGALSLRQGFSTPDGYALLARVAREAAQPYQALAAAHGLDQQGVLEKNPAEALYAVLTAQEEGQLPFASQAFSRLLAGPAGKDLAVTPSMFTALNTPLPTLAPLSQGLATQMLDRTEAALEATRGLLSRPIVTDTPIDTSASGSGRTAPEAPASDG